MGYMDVFIHSQLVEAIRNGNVADVTKWLEKGADVNAKWATGEEGRTPLHVAVSQKGDKMLEVAGLLLAHGANLSVRDSLQAMPLHIACRNGQLDMVHLLLNYGAVVDATGASNQRMTPLHEACKHNHVEIVRLLLQYSADAKIEDWNGKTPLQIATELGHTQVIQALESHSQSLTRQENEVTSHASNDSNFATVPAAEEKTKSKEELLWRAASDGEVSAASQQIQRGALVDYCHGGRGETALRVASQNGHYEVVALLINHGADVNARDSAMNTPLHAAVGHFGIAQLLLEKGTDVNAKNTVDITPLHIATRRGNAEIVRLLLENGADVHIADKMFRQTPLVLAIKKGHWDNYRLLLERADVATKKYALYFASGKGRAEIVLFLLDDGADVNSNDGVNESTPLHCASRGGHLETVRLLLSRGANAEIKDRTGATPLKCARDGGHTTVVTALESHIAAVAQTTSQQVDPEGQTPVELEQVIGQVQLQANDRMEEMDRLMNQLSQINPAMIGQSEELNLLVEQFDLLYAVAMDRQQSIDEQIERQAIYASMEHREFYCMLFNKLDCTILACKSLASGMVQQSSQGSFRMWLSSLVRARSIDAVMENTPLGQLVRESITWAADQVPFPFVKTFGTIFHALFSIRQERDKYLAVARVAAFASIAEEMGGASTILARVARSIVRSDRFVGKEPEFAEWQQWALQMLAEPMSRSKAQGCLIAEQVLQCIMIPRQDCPIQKVLDGRDNQTALDVAVVSVALNLSVEEVLAMRPFVTAEARQQVTTGVHETSQQDHHTVPLDTVASNQDYTDVSERLRRLENENEALREQVNRNDDGEVLERLRRIEEENRRLQHQISRNSGNDSNDDLEMDAGGGMVQAYANEEQRYEGRLEQLEQQMIVHDQRLNDVSSEQVMMREIEENHARDIQAQIEALRAGASQRNRGTGLFRGRRPRQGRPGADP